MITMTDPDNLQSELSATYDWYVEHDENGIIIGRDLRGNALEEMLEEYL